MARIRSLKPETASDRKLAGASRDARYTFVLLISQADDDGLLRAEPRQLLGALYPFDEDVDSATLETWLAELQAIGAICYRRTRDGVRVVELVNWAKHQIIKNRSKPFLLLQLDGQCTSPPTQSSVGSTETLRRPATDPGGAESRVLSLEPRVSTPPTPPPAAVAASVAVVVSTLSNGHANGNGHHHGASKQPKGLPAVVDRGRAAIAEMLALGERESQTDRERRAMISVVFSYWAAKLNHIRALQDPGRERLIGDRLRENRHDVNELMFVIDGAKKDRNLMGQNEKNQKYDGIDTLFRNRAQVERLADLGGYTTGKIHPQILKLSESQPCQS